MADLSPTEPSSTDPDSPTSSPAPPSPRRSEASETVRKAVEGVKHPVSWWRRLSSRAKELATLILLVLVTAGVWGFTELADEVQEGDTHEIDESILLSLRTPGDRADPLGPGWVEEMGRDFTALGGIAFLSLLTLVAAGYLMMIRKQRAALLLVVAVAGGLLLSTLLKHGYDRPRPDLVPHGSITYTSSFPSGHSMLSAVTFLTIGALMARVQDRRATKAYLLAVAILLTVLVGVSRVYLGVHWPTDVLAGWTGGATWALLCWTVARWLQNRRQVEGEEPQPEVGPKQGVGDDAPPVPSS